MPILWGRRPLESTICATEKQLSLKQSATCFFHNSETMFCYCWQNLLDCYNLDVPSLASGAFLFWILKTNVRASCRASNLQVFTYLQVKKKPADLGTLCKVCLALNWLCSNRSFSVVARISQFLIVVLSWILITPVNEDIAWGYI